MPQGAGGQNGRPDGKRSRLQHGESEDTERAHAKKNKASIQAQLRVNLRAQKLQIKRCPEVESKKEKDAKEKSPKMR